MNAFTDTEAPTLPFSICTKSLFHRFSESEVDLQLSKKNRLKKDAGDVEGGCAAGMASHPLTVLERSTLSERSRSEGRGRFSLCRNRLPYGRR